MEALNTILPLPTDAPREYLAVLLTISVLLTLVMLFRRLRRQRAYRAVRAGDRVATLAERWIDHGNTSPLPDPSPTANQLANAPQSSRVRGLLLHARAVDHPEELAAARALILEALEQEPGCEEAWLWLAETSRGPSEATQHLQSLLRFNPRCLAAQRGLAEIIRSTCRANHELTALDHSSAQIVAADEEQIVDDEGAPDWGTQAAWSTAAASLSADAETLVHLGQQAARAGDLFGAREAFLQALDQDPHDEEAWLWLAGSSDESRETELCLRTVLWLNPSNRRALAGIQAIEQNTAA